MPKLELPADHVRTAADARRAVLAAQRRRAGAMRREVRPARPAVIPTLRAAAQPVAAKPPDTWRPINSKLCRQLGIPSAALKKGDMRGQPFVSYRQLTVALHCRLTRMNLAAIGRLYNIGRSSIIAASRRMKPVLDATGLDDDAPVALWIEAALPHLFRDIAERRRACAAHAKVSIRKNGSPPPLPGAAVVVRPLVSPTAFAGG
jgi:hypothetical protein